MIFDKEKFKEKYDEEVFNSETYQELLEQGRRAVILTKGYLKRAVGGALITCACVAAGVISLLSHASQSVKLSALIASAGTAAYAIFHGVRSKHFKDKKEEIQSGIEKTELNMKKNAMAYAITCETPEENQKINDDEYLTELVKKHDNFELQ